MIKRKKDEFRMNNGRYEGDSDLGALPKELAELGHSNMSVDQQNEHRASAYVTSFSSFNIER